MPRMDDPNIKVKETKKYKRESLRPWDEIDKFKPISTYSEKLQSEKILSKEDFSNQLVNKKDTDKEHKETNKEHDKNEEETISEPISKHTTTTNREQLVSQSVNREPSEPSIFEAIKRICGLQRKLLLYIVENCKSRGLLYTTPVTNEILRRLLNTNADSVKTSTQRLIKKGLVCREKGKRGKGGYSVFIITETVRNGVIETERQLNIGNQLENQLVNAISKLSENNWATNKGTLAPSSSGIIINNKNTTTSPEEIEMPVEWQEVDLTELTKRNVYFSSTHVVQLFPFLREYSAFDFQESVDGFVYDIDNKHVHAKKGLLNLFIGIIRNGGLYISSHYISDEKKLIKEMAARSADMKKEKIEAQKETHRLAMREKIVQWAMNEYGAEKIEKELPPYLLADFKANGDAWVEYVYQYLYLKHTISQA